MSRTGLEQVYTKQRNSEGLERISKAVQQVKGVNSLVSRLTCPHHHACHRDACPMCTAAAAAHPQHKPTVLSPAIGHVTGLLGMCARSAGA